MSFYVYETQYEPREGEVGMKKYIGIVYVNGQELFLLIDARSEERANLIMQASFKNHEWGPLALLEPNEEEGVSHEMWSSN